MADDYQSEGRIEVIWVVAKQASLALSFGFSTAYSLRGCLAEPYESRNHLIGELSDTLRFESHAVITLNFATENRLHLMGLLSQPFESYHHLIGELSDVTPVESRAVITLNFATENRLHLMGLLSQPFESYHHLIGELSDVTPVESHAVITLNFATENRLHLMGLLSQPFESYHHLIGELSDVMPVESHAVITLNFATENRLHLVGMLSQPFESHATIAVIFSLPYESRLHLIGNIGNPGYESRHHLKGRIGRNPTILVKAENYMLYRGRKIQVLEATGLSIDSSKFAWSATVNLVHWTDFKTLRNGDEFDLVLQGDHYRLMIDDQGLDRDSSPKLGLSLSCVSPTVRLDNDTYSQINRSWTDKKPTEIIADFLPDDFVIDWQTDDSPIKQYIASGKTIMGVIRELAERIGAIVQTQRDGHTIEIYPFYRIKPEAWATTAIPETHYFREGNLSLKMTWGKIKKWNSVVISDEEDNPSCEMEVIDDSKLRLYPVPFREMDVGTSHLSGVYIGTLRYGEAIERECNLEFKEGKTSVKFPIYKINKFDWGENLDLGTPDYTIDQKDLIVSTDNTFSGHSLASIEYAKRFYECAIGYPKGTTVQFLAIEKN